MFFSGTAPAPARWLVNIIKEANLTEMDWFRQSQDRKFWRKKIAITFPVKKNTNRHRYALDNWRPGLPLPDPAAQADEDNDDQERAAAPAPVQVQAEEEEEDEQSDINIQGNVTYACPVCNEEFTAGNQLQYHYDECHSVRDPDIVTLISKRCE